MDNSTHASDTAIPSEQATDDQQIPNYQPSRNLLELPNENLGPIVDNIEGHRDLFNLSTVNQLFSEIVKDHLYTALRLPESTGDSELDGNNLLYLFRTLTTNQELARKVTSIQCPSPARSTHLSRRHMSMLQEFLPDNFIGSKHIIDYANTCRTSNADAQHSILVGLILLQLNQLKSLDLQLTIGSCSLLGQVIRICRSWAPNRLSQLQKVTFRPSEGPIGVIRVIPGLPWDVRNLLTYFTSIHELVLAPNLSTGSYGLASFLEDAGTIPSITKLTIQSHPMDTESLRAMVETYPNVTEFNYEVHPGTGGGRTIDQHGSLQAICDPIQPWLPQLKLLKIEINSARNHLEIGADDDANSVINATIAMMVEQYSIDLSELSTASNYVENQLAGKNGDIGW